MERILTVQSYEMDEFTTMPKSKLYNTSRNMSSFGEERNEINLLHVATRLYCQVRNASGYMLKLINAKYLDWYSLHLINITSNIVIPYSKN